MGFGNGPGRISSAARGPALNHTAYAYSFAAASFAAAPAPAIGLALGAIGSGLSGCGNVRRPRNALPFFGSAGLDPKLTRDLDRVDAGLLPPGPLVTGAMNRTVVDAAERHGEFVAGLAAERPWLHEPKMMRVGRLAAAKEARLPGDKSNMFAVAVAAGRPDRELTLVDTGGLLAVRTAAAVDLLVAGRCRFRGAGTHLRHTIVGQRNRR